MPANSVAGLVAGLFVYPIKGCRGVPVDSARIERRGLRHDRRWMLAHRDTGEFLSQRSHPAMARIVVRAAEDGALTVRDGGGSAFTLPFVPDGELVRRDVSVWSFAGEALDCGEEAAAFFTESLGVPVRLTRVPDDFSRRVKPEYAVSPEDGPGFADGFPVLLTTEPSLADLNARLSEPIPMDRFRPNVVLAGDFAPWAEHDWRVLRFGGGADFHAVKPCDRCAVTTIDQHSGIKNGPEPLSTLATFRRDPQTGKVYFGVNLIPAGNAVSRSVAVGDSIAWG